MTTCGYMGLYWAHDEKFWDGTVSIDRYAQYINKVNGGNNPPPPPPGATRPVVPRAAPKVASRPKAPVTPRSRTASSFLSVDNTVRSGSSHFTYQGTGWQSCRSAVTASCTGGRRPGPPILEIKYG